MIVDGVAVVVDVFGRETRDESLSFHHISFSLVADLEFTCEIRLIFQAHTVCSGVYSLFLESTEKLHISEKKQDMRKQQ